MTFARFAPMVGALVLAALMLGASSAAAATRTISADRPIAVERAVYSNAGGQT